MNALPSLARMHWRQPRPTFAPLAWLKLQFFCHNIHRVPNLLSASGVRKGSSAAVGSPWEPLAPETTLGGIRTPCPNP